MKEIKSFSQLQEAFLANLSHDELDLFADFWKNLIGCYSAWRLNFKNGEKEMANYKKQLLLGLFERKFLDPARLFYALKNAREDNSKFLPSVGEVISWCVSYSPPRQPPPPKQLEVEITQEQRSQNLQKLKYLMEGAKREEIRNIKDDEERKSALLAFVEKNVRVSGEH